MAKLVSKHFGMLLSVEPTEKTKDDKTWSWRKKYEGFLGIIHVYQSQHRSLNKHFIAICDIDLNCLETSSGELTHRSNILTLTTRNSIYIFKLIDIEERDSE